MNVRAKLLISLSCITLNQEQYKNIFFLKLICRSHLCQAQLLVPNNVPMPYMSYSLKKSCPNKELHTKRPRLFLFWSLYLLKNNVFKSNMINIKSNTFPRLLLCTVMNKQARIMWLLRKTLLILRSNSLWRNKFALQTDEGTSIV